MKKKKCNVNSFTFMISYNKNYKTLILWEHNTYHIISIFEAEIRHGANFMFRRERIHTLSFFILRVARLKHTIIF